MSRNILNSVSVKTLGVALAIVLAGCASDTKNQNRAKEAAARYWSDKAYPASPMTCR